MARSRSAVALVTFVENKKFVVKEVRGFIVLMPRGSVAKGMKQKGREAFPRNRDMYRKVRLFRFGQRWWLHYQRNRLTGSFPSKAKAVDWFVKGGR